jgi:thiamine biosynthesis protein ThiI
VKFVSLVSGGIDSPVASYLVSETGADVVLLHMSNGDFGDPKDLEKVISIAKQLEIYTKKEFPVYVADHGRNQRIIKDNCDPHYQCVMCKRIMQRVCKKFAISEGASGIVMGDSLGQVASQTLTNIRAEQNGLDFPVLRPLIGLDKTEVISIAKRIGTFDISTIRTSGCAAVPKGPVTEAKVEKVAEMQDAIDIDSVVDECVRSIRRVYRRARAFCVVPGGSVRSLHNIRL